MELNKYEISIEKDIQDLQSPLSPQSNIRSTFILLQSLNNLHNDHSQWQLPHRSFESSKVSFIQRKSIEQCPQANQTSQKMISQNNFMEQIKNIIEIREVYSTNDINTNNSIIMLISAIDSIYIRKLKQCFNIMLDNKNLSKIKNETQQFYIDKQNNVQNIKQVQIYVDKKQIVQEFTEIINNIFMNKIRLWFGKIFCHNIDELFKNQTILVPQNSLQFILSRVHTQNQTQNNCISIQINEKDSEQMPKNFLYQTQMEFNPSEQNMVQFKTMAKKKITYKYPTILNTDSLQMIMKSQQNVQCQQSKYVKHQQQSTSVLKFNKNIKRKSKLSKNVSPTSAYSPKIEKKIRNKRIFHSDEKQIKIEKHLDNFQEKIRYNFNKNKKTQTLQTIKSHTPQQACFHNKNNKQKFNLQEPLSKQHFEVHSEISKNTYYLRPDIIKDQINDVSDNLIVRCIDSDPDHIFDIFVEQPYSLSNLTSMMISSQQSIKNQNEKIDKYQINLCPSCYRSSVFTSRKSQQGDRQYSQKLKYFYNEKQCPQELGGKNQLKQQSTLKIIQIEEYETVEKSAVNSSLNEN